MFSVVIVPQYRNRAAPPEFEHTELALQASDTAAMPFPHSIVRGFLPSPLFAALRDAFPQAESELQPVHQRRRDIGYSDKRFSVPLPPPNTEEAAALPGPIRALQQLLTCDRMVMGLLGRFSDVVAPNLADMQTKGGRSYVPLRTSIELICDRSGFELVPHTDAATKLVTGLLYLADPGDPPDLGTRLYAPIDSSLRSDGRSPVDRACLREEGMAPYEPNLFLCFPRSGQSLHGVEATDHHQPRRLVQYSIMAA